jgi:hypothetical protein
MKQKLTKQDTGFTQVKNEVLSDPRLSLKAKGLFALLYSKPDNWDFSGDRLTDETSDGRKAIYSALEELEVAGYLVRERNSSGKMDYYVCWDPTAQKGQEADEPNAQNGKEPKRLIAERGSISNKEYITNIETEVTLKAEPSSAGKKVAFTALGVEVIRAFEAVDPKNKLYYKNTTQRAACDFLLEEYGLDEVLKRISVLPRTNRTRHFPVITTPCQLRDKWVQLNEAAERHRNEAITKKSNVAFS